MKAYVSLHMDWPRDQLDREVSYQGYRRLEVDFDEARLSSKAIMARFPAVQKSTEQTATYVAIGSAAEGQGVLHLAAPILPHVALRDYPERRTDAFWLDRGLPEEHVKIAIEKKGYTCPEVGIGNNSPVEYPASLNPITREAHRLVTLGLLRADEIPHQLYEMINDELQAAGIPVIPVIRSGATHMKIDLKNFTLSELGQA